MTLPLILTLPAGDHTLAYACAAFAASTLSGGILLMADPAIETWRGRAGLLFGIGVPGTTVAAAVMSLALCIAYG